MNYLAHAYLSFDNPDILFGNFIGDFVKGRYNKNLPENVWKGVLLHREIDFLTDNHRATKESKALVREDLGLVSGIFVDMIFDHVLANKWKEYSKVHLKEFTENTYGIIDEYKQHHSENFSLMFQYMRNDNWLYKYENSTDMSRYLKGMSNRLKMDNNLEGSYRLYTENDVRLNENFNILFKDLIDLAIKY